jgi:hypothetical protein
METDNQEKEEKKRHLEVMSLLKAVPEETCSTYDSEDSCNAGDCSWCKAGAVADKCHSIENGKRLPPAVFQCSNIDEEVEEEIEGPDDEEMCSTYTDDDDCNAQSDKCSWCKSGAVADKCHSIENAVRLPAAVFACSNLPSARDMFLLRAERMIEESEAMF